MGIEGFRLNPKTLMPEFASAASLTRKDIEKDKPVQWMIETKECPKCKHPYPDGWDRLGKYLLVAEENFKGILFESLRTRAGREATLLKAAAWKGFDEYKKIPERLIDRIKQWEAINLKALQEKDAEQKETEGGGNNAVSTESEFEVIDE